MPKVQDWLTKNWPSSTKRISHVDEDRKGGRFPGDLVIDNYANLKEIDLSDYAVSNVKLPLTSLIIKNCPLLTEIRIDSRHTKANQIIITNCPHLKKIRASDIGLREIEIKSCPAITELDVSNNYLTSLDLSQLSELKRLFIRGNSALTCLNLTNNQKINHLFSDPDLKIAWERERESRILCYTII